MQSLSRPPRSRSTHGIRYGEKTSGLVQNSFKAHVNFVLDVLFGEVDVSLGSEVDDVDIDALAGAQADVGGDDDEGVCHAGGPCSICTFRSGFWLGGGRTR